MTKENKKSITPEGHSTGCLPSDAEFERLMPIVLSENSELIEALAKK
ncbi:hypothetical protein V7O61_06490 [Methanolobus sp. WCC1]